MAYYREVKWYGLDEQHLMPIVAATAAVFAQTGKHVQVFPGFTAGRNTPVSIIYLCIADSPLKIHAICHQAQLTVVTSPLLITRAIADFSQTLSSKQEYNSPVFLITAPFPPETIKERFPGSASPQILCLDIFSIIHQEIGETFPAFVTHFIMAVLVNRWLQLLPTETFQRELSRFLPASREPNIEKALLKILELAIPSQSQKFDGGFRII